MTYTVSITSQGQMSIPIQLRRKFGLDKNRTVLVTEQDNGKFLVEPVKDFLELGGSLKTNKKPLSNAELDDVVGTAVAQEYAEKLKRSR